MLAALAAARVPIRQIRLNPGRAQPVAPALQALLSKHGELKARPPARRARAAKRGPPCAGAAGEPCAPACSARGWEWG